MRSHRIERQKELTGREHNHNNTNNYIYLVYISLHFASHYAFTYADPSHDQEIDSSLPRVDELA
jgi:hypothetical protein